MTNDDNYKKAYLREKKAREKAEEILDNRTRELFLAHEQIVSHQEQLIKAEKMSLLGRLSAGIAHEINTPLGYCASNISLLNEYIEVFQRICSELQEWIFSPQSSQEKDGAAFCAKIKQTWEDEQVDFLLAESPKIISETEMGLERIKKLLQT